MLLSVPDILLQAIFGLSSCPHCNHSVANSIKVALGRALEKVIYCRRTFLAIDYHPERCRPGPPDRVKTRDNTFWLGEMSYKRVLKAGARADVLSGLYVQMAGRPELFTVSEANVY